MPETKKASSADRKTETRMRQPPWREEKSVRPHQHHMPVASTLRPRVRQLEYVRAVGEIMDVSHRIAVLSWLAACLKLASLGLSP
ncbi:hypothetical protein T265_01321 [Opisthorchis viverrini]|uniref:Uncharacterized protein n=1 Tax=Opisthorchis viverrini TaxID=6198 RepID=A0A075AJ23_OPIVI|nr:hypothetical protein T265_01321 [Opisthorchis viverrini]KER32634.1 hypothetical protein T265_01321 [Opisthorchis viverrini]